MLHPARALMLMLNCSGYFSSKAWYDVLEGFSKSSWLKNIYAAKGKLLSLAL